MNRDASEQLAPFLVLTILVLAIGLLTNLSYRYIPVSPRVHGNHLVGVSALQAETEYLMAGFPMTFYRSVLKSSSNHEKESDDQTSSVIVKEKHAILKDDWFNPVRLVINAIFWLAVVAVVMGVLRWRSRWLKNEFQVTKRRRLLEVLVATSILAIPGIYFGYHALRLRKQTQLINEISQFGACGTVTWLPRCIADQVPRALHPVLGQIQLVSVSMPPPQLLHRLGQLPLLQSLEIHGQTSLEPLANAKMGTSIQQLSLVRTTLDRSHNRFFKTHPQLQTLHSSLVRGSESEMKVICDLPSLRHLIMEDCELPLKGLSSSKSSDSIELLAVSIGVHPDEELSIVGWGHLKEFSAIQRGNRIKPWLTKVRFHRCPRLEKVSLDELRRYDAEFVGNPELALLNTAYKNDQFNEIRSFITFDQQYNRFILRQCPKLGSISFSLVGMVELDIADAGGLTGVTCTAYDPAYRSLLRLAEIDQSIVDQLLEQVGRIPTLERLSLGGVSVNSADLGLLGKLPSLGELQFNYLAPDSSQLKLLEPLQSLEQIDLPNCKLQDEHLSFLLHRFPKLVGVTVDVREVKTFLIKEPSNFRWIYSTPFSSIESFHFSNPKFQSGFHLGSNLKNLTIENSPKLSALIVDAPLPADHRIKDLRDVQIFMVGGKHVGDEIIETIENCGELERLMLAYTSVSKDKLKSIGNFSRLRGLSVPGNPVDDDTIHHWSDLKELWSLDLSETQVDIAAIQWAIKNKSLRYLNISGVPLSKAAKIKLAELSQLTFLSIAHNEISPAELGKILEIPSLAYLDLSGIQLTAQHFDVLAQSKPPGLIIARGCGFTASQFEDYCNRQSSGRWDVGSSRPDLLPLSWDGSSEDSAPKDVSGTKLAKRLVADGVIHSYHHSLTYEKNLIKHEESKRDHLSKNIGVFLQATGELATWDTSQYRAEKLASPPETALSRPKRTNGK